MNKCRYIFISTYVYIYIYMHIFMNRLHIICIIVRHDCVMYCSSVFKCTYIIIYVCHCGFFEIQHLHIHFMLTKDIAGRLK